MKNSQHIDSPFQLGSSQLTTGGGDPLLPKLIHAINHAHEIEITVSFIQRSGLALLFEPLKDALGKNCTLKLLTSDYLDITDPVALRELMPLVDRGADVRIFESRNKQSFHMKSYIFVKTKTGEVGAEIADGSAFIGSNNISKTALTHAYEWCYRHDFSPPMDSKEALTFLEIRKSFHNIFSNQYVVELTNDWISKYIARRSILKLSNVVDVIDRVLEPPTPNATQYEALIALQSTREQGFKRGLVVLATGMGKTWLSAFDVKQMKAKKVLFVAHREEILLQSQRTFAQLLSDQSSGFYNANRRDVTADLLFASVQTIGKKKHLTTFSKDHFDYVIVDEFHHASARTYQNLLAYFEPNFLLGLTATPERTDQADILGLCDNNLVFERNLTQGINEKILVPFRYYGIWDADVDYKAIPWRNGRFDPNELDAQFVTHKRCLHVFDHWRKHRQSTTLAFCISKKHADFMAEYFIKKGIKAVSVHSESVVRRNDALRQLEAGEIEIIFSVDLFNEGTDLPAIDTILMLRPSDSKILFLQQLGRGLRLFENKDQLVVLDFIGNHHSFLNKPAALLGSGTIKETLEKCANPIIADGCFVNYDIEIINFWEVLARKQRTTALEDYQNLYEILGHQPTVSEFYLEYKSLDKVKNQHGSWFQMALPDEDKKAFEPYQMFLMDAVQTTSMTKCFKAIMLASFLRLDGFKSPPTLQTLASDSWHVLNRYPHLMSTELPGNKEQLTADSTGWLSYWKGNPIQAFCKISRSAGKAWFRIEGDLFIANLEVSDTEKNKFHDCVQELLDYRLLKYSQKKSPVSSVSNINDKVKEEAVVETLPFYPNLKIACGHFKAGDDTQAQYINAPEGFGQLNAKKHFLAYATGNSMNGGKSPILDGDLLLLELISPDNPVSLNGQTIVIENQAATGDDQYLLRDVKKLAEGRYQLIAKNDEYETIISSDDMKTLAKLKGVIASDEVNSH